MERRSLFGMLTLALAAQGLAAAGYYVAPGGDDAASGSLAAPWKTLAKAAAMAQPGDTVTLRQGAYRETLTAQRSGSSAAPIVFRGYPGESAVLAGSDLVTGSWSLHGGKIWRIDGLPATWDVYVDGQQMTEARWPNAALGSAMDAGLASADTGTNSTTLVDAALPATDLSGAKVRIAAGSAWVSYSRTVQGYGGGQFSFDSAAGPNASYWPKAGNFYVLYRHLALLDSAGEWYQDPATKRLYLWLPAGDPPGIHQVEIAVRKQVAVVSGYSYVQLRDLYTFSGGVNFINSTGSKVLGVHQRYVHTNNDVDGYNYPSTPNQFSGGSGGEWAQGSIAGSSGDGLFISGSGHSVHDMSIHDVCRVGTYRAAVHTNGSNHLVEHNTLYDSGRFLIFHGSTKGGALRYNHMYNAGLLTKDLGATYCFQTNGGGMEIAYNHVHDIHCEVGAGIYLDNGSADFRVHHNLVHDVDWFALKLNLPSYGNLVVNNTLFASKYWVNAHGNASYAQEMTGTALVNNLYGGGGTAKLVTGALGPTLITNGTYTAPPAIFATGAWTLAAGSPAIDKGTVYTPYGDVYCGAKPDQGAYEYACGTAWSAGSTVAVPAFPYPLPSSSVPTATASRTSTRTPSASPSRTGTPSVTPTATRTVTASATRTATSSFTPSSTRSATPTSTPSASRTPTASATSSATPSGTLSATPSATPSATSSRTSSATPSTTPSAASSATPSETFSATPSGTPSTSASATPSGTSSATPNGTSSATPSTSPSLTRTPTASATPSPSWSATSSASRTATCSATPSVTPGASLTVSSTASPSRTATPSTSPTASPASTATPSATAEATGTVSPSPLPSFTATPAAPAPGPELGGPLRLRRAVVAPNPVRGGRLRLSLEAEGPADLILLRVYSPALVCVLEAQLPGSATAGWSQASVGLEGLPRGLYHAQVRLKRGPLLSSAVLATFYLDVQP